jgi:hypothetical protein
MSIYVNPGFTRSSRQGQGPRDYDRGAGGNGDIRDQPYHPHHDRRDINNDRPPPPHHDRRDMNNDRPPPPHPEYNPSYHQHQQYHQPYPQQSSYRFQIFIFLLSFKPSLRILYTFLYKV